MGIASVSKVQAGSGRWDSSAVVKSFVMSKSTGGVFGRAETRH